MVYHVRRSFTLVFTRRIKNSGFADDIALAVMTEPIHKIVTAVNEAIWKIQGWFQNAGVAFPDYKTKVVLITNRKAGIYQNKELESKSRKQ